MKCPNCHQEIDSSRKFCDQCGHPLPQIPETPKKPSAAENTAQIAAAESESAKKDPEVLSGEAEQSSKKKASGKSKKTAILIASLSAVLVLGAGAVAFTYFWSKNASKQTAELAKTEQEEIVEVSSPEASEEKVMKTVSALTDGKVYTEAFNLSSASSDVSAGESKEIKAVLTGDNETWGKVSDDEWILLEDKSGKGWMDAVSEDKLQVPANQTFKAENTVKAYILPDAASKEEEEIAKDQVFDVSVTYSSDGNVWGRNSEGKWVLLSDASGIYAKTYSETAAETKTEENAKTEEQDSSETKTEENKEQQAQQPAGQQVQNSAPAASQAPATYTVGISMPVKLAENYSGPAVIQSVASAYGSSVDQQSIANSAGLNTGGIMTYQTFTSYLNNYTGGRYNYFYSNNGAFGAADRDAFRTAVASCLMSGKPVVVVVERSVLGLPAGRSYAVIYSATPQADQYSLYVPGLQGQANQASATFDGIINAMAQAGYVLRIY